MRSEPTHGRRPLREVFCFLQLTMCRFADTTIIFLPKTLVLTFRSRSWMQNIFALSWKIIPLTASARWLKWTLYKLTGSLCCRALMTEEQVLFDTIKVGWIYQPDFFHAPAAFRIFCVHQVAPAGALDKDFAGDLETFGCWFSGFSTFGTSHTGFFIWGTLEYSCVQDGLKGISGVLSSCSPAKRLNRFLNSIAAESI